MTGEEWGAEALRLARAVQAAKPNAFTSTKGERTRYASLHYSLQLHLDRVPLEDTCTQREIARR